MIRWNYLLPRLGILFIAGLVVNGFSGPLVRSVIVHSVQGVTGAKVDIGRLDCSLLNGRLQIAGLQLADPANPMQNLVQADHATLELDSALLLHKRWVVENASLHNLQFGTPRTESGKLEGPMRPARTPESKTIRIARDQAGRLGRDWLEKLESRIPVLIQDNLETVRLARELNTSWPEEFEKQCRRACQFQKQAREIREILEDRSENPLRDFRRYQDALLEARQVMNGIAQAREDLHRLYEKFQADRQRIVDASERDRQRISTLTADLALDGRGVTELLLGKSQANQVREVLGWIKWFRDLVPDPREDFHPIRARGQDVPFRRHPRFVFRNLQLEGEGRVAGQNISFGGTAKNLSTAPQLLDEPATFELRGKGATHIQVFAEVDRRGAQKTDHLTVHCPNIHLPAQTLGASDALLLDVGASDLSLMIDTRLVDDQLHGKIVVRQTDVDMKVRGAPAVTGGQALVDSLNHRLASVGDFEVTIDLGGSLSSPTMELQSNLGPRVAELISLAFRETVARSARSRAADLDKILAGQLSRLDQMFAVQSAELVQLLSGDVPVIADLGEILNERNLRLPAIR